MFTYRYHAISLVAVFLALGIGVLLGVAIGEEGVVSNASKDLESSLRGDLQNARATNSRLRREVRLREDYESQAYPGLVRDTLPDHRVGIVALGAMPSGFTSAIRDAVEPAGAQVDSLSVIAAPLPRGKLGSALDGTKLQRVDHSEDVLAQLGRRIGRQLVAGGDLVQRLRHDLFSTSRGEYGGLDAVVLVRGSDHRDLERRQKSAQDRFERELISALKDTDAAVVGVESTGTDPSQIGFMKDRGVSSVDDIDLTVGKTALVWAMLGGDGHYGVKSSAERLLPAPPERAGR